MSSVIVLQPFATLTQVHKGTRSSKPTQRPSTGETKGHLPIGAGAAKAGQHARSASISSLSSRPFNSSTHTRTHSPASSVSSAAAPIHPPPGLTPPRRLRRGPPPALIIPDYTTPRHAASISTNRITTPISPKTRVGSRRHHRGASSHPPSPSAQLVLDPAEIRRKRLDKLARHFGEPVPEHLIVPPSARAHAGKALGPPRERDEPRAQSWVGEWNRENMMDVQKGLRALKMR
ncbi:hypothetical protein FIBSPDRAFT_868438 [Athelia psychrophila]|uniref:Uncharacterized protein n=1 Tax=Athelia psychrophila TaxID=1759441 RepID=A0A166D5J2_9AGAM|nr:hypothetical protein FIBSPDRAFT_879039 [Fibularhizoctonia sp. CBS 109695]KZP14342.1 hypothetical protein FIBSPDRAFT_868438 [Fibularhizoctonia sp. CBS 109695]